jgi:hypothetical protein
MSICDLQSSFRRGLLSIAVTFLVGALAAFAREKPPSFELQPLHFEPSLVQGEFVGLAAGKRVNIAPGRFTFYGPGSNADSITFQCSAPTASITGEAMAIGRSNYLIGNDPAKWRTGIVHYQRVRVAELYPGIATVVYGVGNDFEFDLEFAPGTQPTVVKISLTGKPAIQPDGSVVFGNGLRLHRPHAYQETASGRHAVDVRFELQGHTLRFVLGEYNRDRKLTIDPVIDFSTYLTGTAYSNPVAVKVDASGNTYVAGYTNDGFPTANAIQPNHAGGSFDGFVSKLSPDGSTLIYSTYFGGSNYEDAFGFAIDDAGRAFVVGRTESSDFPSVNPMFTVGGNSGFPNHGFIVALKADGSGYEYSSRIGGTGLDFAFAVATDSNSNAYVFGTTQSPDFPRTNGTLPITAPPSGQTTYGFVTKIGLNAAIVYSALIQPLAGTSPSIWAEAIAVTDSGEVIVGGKANGGWPTTPNALHENVPDSQIQDGFITKLTSDGSAYVFSTYLTGSAESWVHALDLDSNGNIIAAGEAAAGLPSTTGAFQPALPNGALLGGFVSKLSPDGTSIIKSTYFASANSFPTTAIRSIALDGQNAIYVGGYANGSGLPLVNPVISAAPNSATGFAAKFSPDLANLLFSTYWGPTIVRPDVGSRIMSIDVHQPSKLTVTGGVLGDGFPTTAGAFQTSIPTLPPFSFPLVGFVSRIGIDTSAPSLCFDRALSLRTNVGTTQARTLRITNCGNADLQIDHFDLTAPFQVMSTTCTGVVVSAAANCTVTVSFTPAAQTTVSGTLGIVGNTSISPYLFGVSGRGTLPAVQLPTQITPNLSVVGVKATPSVFLLLSNFGDGPYQISSATITGDFSITENQCTSLTFGDCFVTIDYTPTQPGTRNGTLTIVDNLPDSPHSIPITAEALAQFPVPVLESLSPGVVAAGKTDFHLWAKGSNYFAQSKIRVNNFDHSVFVSAPYLIESTIAPPEIAQPGELPVQVVNPVPGGGTSATRYLAIYGSMPLRVRGIAEEPYTRRLLVTIPADAPEHANSLLWIDPETRTIEEELAIGTGPSAIAVSEHGTYAFVGVDGERAIKRIDLASRTIDQTFSLADLGDNMRATFLTPYPGDEEKFGAAVISFNQSYFLFYSGTTRLNQFTEFTDIRGFAFSPDGSRLFVSWGSGTIQKYQRQDLGFSFVSNLPGQDFGSLQTDGVQIVSASGRTYDFEGAFKKQMWLGFRSFVADRQLAREFGGFSELEIYDALSGTLSATMNVDQISPSFATLARFGSNGFAIGQQTFSDPNPSFDKLVLFRSRNFYPDTTNEVPSISNLSPANVAPDSDRFILTVDGTSFARGATVRVNGADRTTRFISPTQLQAFIPASDVVHFGVANITVWNPPNGGGVSAAMPLEHDLKITLQRPSRPPRSGASANAAFRTLVSLKVEGPTAGTITFSCQSARGVNCRPRPQQATFGANGAATQLEVVGNSASRLGKRNDLNLVLRLSVNGVTRQVRIDPIAGKIIQ